MNIQLAEGYKNAEKGEKERGFSAVGAGARERKDTWSRGSREGVGAGGPNSKDGVGAGGSREEGHLEPGLERRSRSQGPNSEDGVGAGAREKKDTVRNMSMKRRRD